MSKKLLTLDDLYTFCSTNNFNNFSSDESGYQIFVNTPATFEQEESTDTMLFANIKLLHTERNRNQSNVTYDAAKNCLGSIKYKPILANFCEIDGIKDFTSHDMFINDDGELEYLEHQIGCFTADKPQLVEEDDKFWIYAKVAIPREYTAAAEIIERKNGTKVSAELAVNKMSYDAEKKELLLEDIEVMGCTMLGKNPETGENVEEGMQGAKLSINDFNHKLNYEHNDKLIETLEKLNETLKGFDISTRKEEDDSMSENENFEVEETPVVVEEETVSEVTETAEETIDATIETETEAITEVEEVAEEEMPSTDVQYSMSMGETIKNYSISLNEKIYALQSLVNETYEADGDWYCVEVFDEESVVEMHGWMKSFRQEFKCKKNKYSLCGDRVEIFSKWMTQDEIDAFDRMKANYSIMESNLSETSAKLAKYEAEPAKMDILNSNEYSQIANDERFTELMSNHFDLDIEDVRKNADAILLDYAKNHTLVNNTTAVTSKVFTKEKKKQSRYGDIFSK